MTIRPIRLRDARALERELLDNRGWLRKWEATNPYGPMSFDVRVQHPQPARSTRARASGCRS